MALPQAARGISKGCVPERERPCFGPLERVRFDQIIQTTLPITSKQRRQNTVVCSSVRLLLTYIISGTGIYLKQAGL